VLIGEEEVHKKEERAIFTVYHSDETNDFSKEKKMEETQEIEKEPKKQELENKIVFKVEREAVSRFKEKVEE